MSIDELRSAWDDIDLVYPTEHRPVAVGGDPTAAFLWGAFARGAYPWPASGEIRRELETAHGPAIASGEIPTLPGSKRGFDMPWWCPQTRGYIDATAPRIPRDVRRVLRRSGWTSTVNTRFDEVVLICSRPGQPYFWIDAELRAAYGELHRLGRAHSVEVWDGADLVGALFGVQVGQSFCTESMFSRRDEASRVAIIDTCDRFASVGGAVLDCQGSTDSLVRLGARDGTRDEYLAHLRGSTTGPLGGPRLSVARLVPPG